METPHPFRPLIVSTIVLANVCILAFLFLPSIIPYLIVRRIIWTFIIAAVVKVVRDQIIVPCILMPVVFMGRQNRARYLAMKTDYLRHNPQMIQSVNLVTKDGVKLDALKWMDMTQDDKKPCDQKWIIWFNPNGATYEEEFPFLAKYGKIVCANVLAFNYRGVALSEGALTTSDHLLLDGMAAMEYLTDKGVQPQNILLHGHSMGGAVATEVRRRFPNGPIINDRSFRSLGSVANAILLAITPLRIIISMLIGLVIGCYISVFMEVSASESAMNIFGSMVIVGTIGNYLAGPLADFAELMLGVMGWRLDITSDWAKIHGEKVIIYHLLDGIITHSSASLFEALRSQNKIEGTRIVQLKYINKEETNPNQFYHCYGLDSIENEWKEICRLAKAMLYPDVFDINQATTSASRQAVY